MKRHTIAALLAGLSAATGILIGCHAKPDDPAGQAEELADPVRRENAVENIRTLYTGALSSAREGHQNEEDFDARAVETVQDDRGRDQPGPRAIADATIGGLVTTYRDRSPSPQIGQKILDVLNEMQDPRAIPAFTKALEWRAGVSEEHAVRAAQALERIDIPEGQVGEVVTSLSTAVDRVNENRPVHNRMRIHVIRTLGTIGDQRATPQLTKIATNIAEDQPFTINRLAVEAIGPLRDPSAVPALIKGLFLFQTNDPRMRMNDVAGLALVQTGRAAHEPLVQLLEGNNEDANRIANSYIEAVRQHDEAAAEQMDARSSVVGEACLALGQLGFAEATEPLLVPINELNAMSVSDAEEADGQLLGRAQGCAIALVQVNRNEADTTRVREALIGVYQRVPKLNRPQLLVAMQHAYDPGTLDFLHEVASTEERELPDIRVLAVQSYAFLANGEEAARLQALIDAEPGPAEGGYQTNFQENAPMLATANECGSDLACYIGKLEDDDTMVVRKAAYMIARYGRGNDEAITALIGQLQHSDGQVRADVLYALDWAATNGSAAGVARIDAIRDEEEGRSSWNQIKSVAIAVWSRLQARTDG